MRSGKSEAGKATGQESRFGKAEIMVVFRPAAHGGQPRAKGAAGVPAPSHRTRRGAEARCRALGLKLAAAESCTGGLVCALADGNTRFLGGPRARLRRLFQRGQAGDARRIRRGASRPRRGQRRDGARDGAGRPRPFGRRRRGERHRNRRPGRRHAGEARRPRPFRPARVAADPTFAFERRFGALSRSAIRLASVETALELIEAAVARRSARLAPVDLVGARFEGGGEFAERSVEHRAHQRAEQAAAKLVGDEELDRREARLRGVAEIPDVLEAAERPVDIFDEDFQPRPVERDAAGELFADRRDSRLPCRRSGPRGPRSSSVRRRTRKRLAQRHEFGIALDVGDEIEHLLARNGARAARCETTAWALRPSR